MFLDVEEKLEIPKSISALVKGIAMISLLGDFQKKLYRCLSGW